MTAAIKLFCIRYTPQTQDSSYDLTVKGNKVLNETVNSTFGDIVSVKGITIFTQKSNTIYKILTVNFGRRTLYVSTSSIIKSTKSEKGLSKTIPAIEGSSAPYIRLQE